MLTQVVRNSLKHIAPLHTGVRALRRLKASQRIAVSVIQGRERTSGEPLSLLFTGNNEHRNYIVDLVFGGSETDSNVTRVWKRNLPRHACAADGGYQLAIMHSDTLPAGAIYSCDAFRIPCWVGGEKNLETAADFARRSEHIKSDVRRIRKHQLGYRVTCERQAFDRFYHEMYLPYIRHVFGGHAFLMSYEAMQAAIPRCELFLITHEGHDIAGGILVYDDTDCVRGWSLGVKDGDSQWVRIGALAAFEHLQTGYLQEKGYKRLHRGGSRPFLDDGALSFKKNRGMHITDSTRQSFTLLPLRDSVGIRAFLQNNPFIYDDMGVLKGAIFLPGQPAPDEDLSRLFRERYIAGLDSLTLFCLADSQDRDLPGIRACGRLDDSGTLHVSSTTGKQL